MNAPTAPRFERAKFVGERVPRKEDARLLTGRGTYTDDVVLPGMLHAAFHRSTQAKAKIVSVDLSEALAVPGVRAIYQAPDFDRFNIQMISFFLIVPPPGPKFHPLAYGRVAYVGDPIAIVIADSRHIAEDAASLINVEYAPEEPVITMAQALAGAKVHPDQESNIAAVEARPNPAADEAFRTAKHVVTGKVKHQRICQNPMETRGIVVSKNGEEEISVYLSCQSPHIAARYFALAFNLPPTGLRVIAKDVGGGFGLKNQPGREEMATFSAALILGRPVKWIEDRLEHLTTCNLAREQEMSLRLGFDESGHLLAAHCDYLQQNGAFPQFPDANIAAMMFMWPAYKLPAFSYHAQGVFTNTVGLGGYRGPWAIETLMRETTLDIAARKMGIDPIELRRRNLITAADQPYHDKAFGYFLLEDITPNECLDKLLEKIDVPAFRAEQTAARKQGRYLGLGIATYIEPTAATGFAILASDVANIRIEPTGRVTAILSTHSQGHGTQTTMAQVIADHLGVPFEHVSIYEDDSSRGGFGPGAAGSRQAVSGGGAAIKAAEILVDKVKRIAGHLLNANPDDVRIEDGIVHVSGAAEMTRTLREVAEIAYNEPARLPPDMQSGLEAQYRYQAPPVTWTSAAHGCIVEVDAETGFVDIKRWVCAEDCGVVINPAIVEGQIAGGLAQAIGEVLLEEVHFDAQGNPTTATFKDYLMPAAVNVPDFEYAHVVTPSASVGGFRGVGEGGAIIGPPTLVNAIADALIPFGEIGCDLPLTPTKILGHMEGRNLSGH